MPNFTTHNIFRDGSIGKNHTPNRRRIGKSRVPNQFASTIGKRR